MTTPVMPENMARLPGFTAIVSLRRRFSCRGAGCGHRFPKICHAGSSANTKNVPLMGDLFGLSGAALMDIGPRWLSLN